MDKVEGDKATREQHATEAARRSGSATGGVRKPLHCRPRNVSRRDIQKITELLVHLDICGMTKRIWGTVGDRDCTSVTRCSGLMLSYNCA